MLRLVRRFWSRHTYNHVPVAAADTFTAAGGHEATVFRAEKPDDQPADDLPVYFNGGYGVDSTDYLRYIASRYNRDAWTIVYDTKRRRDSTYWLIDGTSQYQDTVMEAVTPQQARRLPATYAGAIVAQSQLELGTDILQAMDRLDIPQTAAIGQSVGALCVTSAIYQQPGRFSQVSLPYPAGMFRRDWARGPVNVRNYTKAWVRHRFGPAAETFEVIGTDLDGASGAIRTPKSTAADGYNVLVSYHRPLLSAARQAEAHPSVVVVAGEDDHIFSPDRLRQACDEDAVDGMVVIAGLHAISKRRQAMDAVMRSLGE